MASGIFEAPHEAAVSAADVLVCRDMVVVDGHRRLRKKDIQILPNSTPHYLHHTHHQFGLCDSHKTMVVLDEAILGAISVATPADFSSV
jgi:hypothetical protein